MKVYEHEGKSIFKRYGISVPNGQLVTTSAEAATAARTLRCPVMVKAQILSGGRGKAGAVVQADSPEEAESQAARLLGIMIHDLPVDKLLIEEQVPHRFEFYLSLYLDPSTEMLWLLFSPRGGVDVESAADDQMLKLPVSTRVGIEKAPLLSFAQQRGLGATIGCRLLELATILYHCVRERDLLLAEINPLLCTEAGQFIAADARGEIDDNAIFRSDFRADDAATKRERTDMERRAAILGLNGFVELKGEIGILASGAGLGMSTMDLLSDIGLSPANFLETGGRITAELVRGAVELVLDQPGLKGILVNLYGGINPMVEAAHGLIRGAATRAPTIPIVVKLFGNEQEEAWSLLEAAGIPTVHDIETVTAVNKLHTLLEAGS